MAKPVSNQLKTSGTYANKPLDERVEVNRYYASDDDAQNSIRSIESMSGAYVGLHVYVTDLEKNGTDKRGEYVITKLTSPGNDVDMTGVKSVLEFIGAASQTSVTTLAAKVDKLPVGMYYGSFTSVESLPDAENRPYKGYAYVPTTDAGIYYIYTTDGDSTDWVLSENKFYSTNLETNLANKSEDKAPTTKIVAEGIEAIDVTLARSAEDENELTATQKYNASANINNRAVVIDQQTSEVKALGYKVLNPALSFAEQVENVVEDDVIITDNRNTIFEIRDEFDLEGGSVIIPANCTLKFNGGKLKNGTLSGNSTKLDGDIRFGEDVVIAGTYEKKNSLTTSVFDGDYDGVDLIKNIDLLANNLELLNGEVIDVDKVGTTIQLNSIYSNGYATINFKYKTEGTEGLRISNNVGFILRNLNITEDYPTTSSTQITLGSSFVITTSSSGNKAYDLVIENCNFSGRYNSSCLSASNIRSCLVKNCKWTDTIANDHYIYCSTNIKNYSVEHCSITNGKSFGAFKIRATDFITFTCDSLNAVGYEGYCFTFGDLKQASFTFNNVYYDASNISDDSSLFTNLDGIDASGNVYICITSSTIKLSNNASHPIINPGANLGKAGSIEIVDSVIVGWICKYGDITIKNSDISKTCNDLLFNPSIRIDNTKLRIAITSTASTYSLMGLFNFYQRANLFSIKNSAIYTSYAEGAKKPIALVTGSSTNGLKLIIENTYIDSLARSLVYSFTGDISLFLKDNNITLGYGVLFDSAPNANWLNPPYGNSASRPTFPTTNVGNTVGQYYFDTTLKKPIFWNGSAWIYASGEIVGLQVDDTTILLGAAANSSKSVRINSSSQVNVVAQNPDGTTSDLWLSASLWTNSYNIATYRTTINSLYYYYGSAISLQSGETLEVYNNAVILNSSKNAIIPFTADKYYTAASDETIYLATQVTNTNVVYKITPYRTTSIYYLVVEALSANTTNPRGAKVIINDGTDVVIVNVVQNYSTT